MVVVENDNKKNQFELNLWLLLASKYQLC